MSRPMVYRCPKSTCQGKSAGELVEKITQSCIRWTTRTHCHWAEESIATTIAEEEDARVLETEPGLGAGQSCDAVASTVGSQGH